jgi:magnesium chelatase family protein
MLSKRIPSILPDMTRSEELEVTKIYSVLGYVTQDRPLITTRPFRSPHHTISAAGLSGGGSTPRPGEISMAHKGVLFLDELPEFRAETLEVLRQPLEDGQVTISRVSGAVTYPSELMLVCAMNPCKCGWYGDPSGRCTCSQASVEQYRSRISGPLLDRIDLSVDVQAVPFEDLNTKAAGEPSEAIRARVNAARAIQLARFSGTDTGCNAKMTSRQLRACCVLDPAGTAILRQAFDTLGLTARSHDKILKVARTIADLDGSETIQVSHLAEALSYRSSLLGRG